MSHLSLPTTPRHHKIILAVVAVFFAVTIALSAMFILRLQPHAGAASLADFNPGNIMSDAVMSDKSTMTKTQIQRFLKSKASSCTSKGPYSNGSYYIDKLRKTHNNTRAETSDGKYWWYIKDGHFVCMAEASFGGQSAADIIYQAAQDYNINPQALIVLLQKEQGLITDAFPNSQQYNTATGYGCPDNADCNTQYYGLKNQIRLASKLFRDVLNGGWSNYPVGRNFIQYNPSTSCGGSYVNIENRATSALYRYTPYQPNKAALEAGYGTAPCGAYGNRNFYLFFHDWFGTTHSSPFFRINNTAAVYLDGIDNTYYYVGSNDLIEAYGYANNKSGVRSVPSSYTSGKTLAGNLGYMARFEGDAVYFVSNGKKIHAGSREIISQYGMSLGDEARLPEPMGSGLLDSGSVSDILYATSLPSAYHVSDGKKHHITSPDAMNSMGDPLYSSRSKTYMSSGFVNSLPTSAPIMTDGTFVRYSDGDTYGLWDGSKLYTFSADTYNAMSRPPAYSGPSSIFSPLSKHPEQIGRAVKDTSGKSYLISNGTKYYLVDKYLSNYGNLSDQAMTVPTAFVDAISNARPLLPLHRVDGGSAVYYINEGKSYHTTSREVINEYGLDIKDTINLDKTAASLFASTNAVLYKSGTLYRVGHTDPVYLVTSQGNSLHVPSRQLLGDYDMNLRSTISVNADTASLYPSDTTLSSFVRDSQNRYWMITEGSKRHIPASISGQSGYGLSTTNTPLVSSELLETIRTSQSVTRVIRAIDTAPVYLIEDGKKHWVSSWDELEAIGYDKSDVIDVSGVVVGSLPSA